MADSTLRVLWQTAVDHLTATARAGRVTAVERQAAGDRWLLKLSEVVTGLGAHTTRVQVQAGEKRFAFFLRDVNALHPIWIPELGVAVTPADDARDYATLVDQIQRVGGIDGLRQIALEPEETFEAAAAVTRDSQAPIWLGLSRDMRMFEMDWLENQGYWGVIRPKLPKVGIALPEVPAGEVEYGFMVGRGTNCVAEATRRLEGGVLPILHSQVEDGPVQWSLTAFADLERSELSADGLRGTHYLVADRYAFGYSHTPEQTAEVEALIGPEYRDQQEQTLLCLRLSAHNPGTAPAYTWFKAPDTHPWAASGSSPKDLYAASPGLGQLGEDRVFCIGRVEGQPLPQMELPILVQPGATVTIELYLPHQPIDRVRAQALLDQPAEAFVQRHQRCRAFWQAKLDQAATIQLPERRVQEMVQAGLLHLDLITYGHEPVGTLAPMVGRYAPIGTESAPIIQYYDAVGRHDLARRSLQYFFDKQRPSGQMQNYQYYQSETGPVLWTAGEHYRYTRDLDWVRSVAEPMMRACDFLIDWRQRNMTEDLRGRGYGMLDGAVADPEEPTHYFMNAGYAALGLSRVAEMFEAIGDQRCHGLRKEAGAMREDIRHALFDALAVGPVVPLGDGRWAPTCGPFPEAEGALSLYANRHIVVSHGSFVIHDAAIGVLYLLLQEILDPQEPVSDWLLATNHRLNTVRNVAPSQPYYCRHDYAHLRRGEVKAFLKCYYNTFASLADRQTYTFWEHQYRAGVHKTHEEGWFLMQTRWMLLMEQAETATLALLPGVPRAWLVTERGGGTLGFEAMASYFGPVSLSVRACQEQEIIEASVQGASRSLPERVSLRLPHPAGKRARRCEGGRYDPATETVWLDAYAGQGRVVLYF